MAQSPTKTKAESATRLDVPSISTRQPLGQLSPNVTKKTVRSDKSLLGSPLKRSCLSVLDSENGLIYLKRRKLSLTTPRPTVEVEDDRPSNADAGVVNFRFAAPEATQELPPLVSSQSVDEQQHRRQTSRDRSSSSERHSFSSLINYDPSSQTAHSSAQLRQEAAKLPQTTPLLFSKASRAEALRLRLRVAMYKVQTNQIDVPFDYLREETSRGTRESNRAVQEAVEQLRIEALEKIASQRRIRPSSPAPDVEDLAAVVAFPPSSLAQQHQSSLEQHTHTPRSRLSRMVAAELTSSAVKSNVAEGLLGLKNAS